MINGNRKHANSETISINLISPELKPLKGNFQNEQNKHINIIHVLSF